MSNKLTKNIDKTNHEKTDIYAIGNWFVKKYDGEDLLVCIMDHGSNYVSIKSVRIGNNGYHVARIHNNDLEKQLKPVENVEAIIADNIDKYSNEIHLVLAKITEETARLGVTPKQAIAEDIGGSNSLAIISKQTDTNSYKKSLIHARDETLPALFAEVKKAHVNLSIWHEARILPMEAAMKPMKDSIREITERLHTIELYAGLTEEAEKIRDGDPAKTDEKLRIFQRLHFMDEESLIDYDSGGMEWCEIGQFEEWLAKPEITEKIMPFQRCCVAFRIRRNQKEREALNLSQALNNMYKEKMDEYTYLYIRNGEQIWRIDCNHNFGESIFPDRDAYDPANGGYMIRMSGKNVEGLMTRNEYEVRVAELAKKIKEWEDSKDSKDSEDNWRRFSKPSDTYISGAVPFNSDSVYYDDAANMLSEEARQFNQIAIIIQGLFDRSLTLHPHNPVSVWDSHSFEKSIEIIYDSKTLSHGEAPDFEEYKAQLNKSLDKDSVVIGQRLAWLKKSAERENKRTANNWRIETREYTVYQPLGDKGPAEPAVMDEWRPRSRKALFRWERESRDYSKDYSKPISCRLLVQDTELFNVSAYKKGDYLRFFQDHRTRVKYLKWAPILLMAEKYHQSLKNKNKD